MSTMLLLLLMLIISCWMMKISHPVSMAGLLILMALASSLFLGKLIISWVLYLLALVFLGGVMVVLLFMVSVCANEKFFYSVGPQIGPSLIFWGISSLIIAKNTALSEGMSGVSTPLVLYQSDGMFSFILFMLILVLCMLSVVKISKLESGPMVKRL
uniref:NADH dehydrogenase subunit 6 n=1 Tax=Labidocera rotunda TaxID=207950 RepID=UPI0020375491|nr:NADH dehydrogenase subunit 6 [Labidocera rotunda]URC16611.1 NADH dehydrogenase subunit 6 [Labidocera rotunda]